MLVIAVGNNIVFGFLRLDLSPRWIRNSTGVPKFYRCTL